MKDITSLFEFMVDLVCMMPPLETAQLTNIPKDIPIVVCLVAVAVFFFTVLVKIVAETFPGNKIIAVILAGSISVLSFAFIDRSIWEPIFTTGYLAMIMSLRGVEGILIGSSFRLKTWIPIFISLVTVAIILYVTLKPIPRDTLALIKIVWAFSGALFASFRWTRILGKSEKSFFGGPLSGFAIFIVFLSTIMYVTSSRADQLIFQFVFPAGLFVGIIMIGTKRVKKSFEEPNKAPEPTA